mgnify:CR=1 FL=1
MSNEKVSHNIVPGVDDMEYVEMFNLNPALAYTPEINEAILNRVYEDNVAAAMSEGMTEEEAKADSEVQRSRARATIDRALEQRKK